MNPKCSAQLNAARVADLELSAAELKAAFEAIPDAQRAALVAASLAAQAQTAPRRTYIVQLADAPADADAQMVNRMQERLLPGTGVIDFAAFIAALGATGTTAPAGIEMFSAALDALPPAEAAHTCAAALDFCLS